MTDSCELTLDPQSASENVMEPRRVLIVDDDEAMSEVLTIRLRQLGYETQSAKDAATGTAMARDGRPSVILLDILLPDGDGLEICRSLGDSPETWSIPVIIVSGSSNAPGLMRQCRDAGARYFLRKPYDPNVLLCLIREALDTRSAW